VDSATTIPEPQSDDVEATPSNSANELKLCTAARLPTLANHCFIVGEAKRADVIWSEGDFLAICEHMLNENPPNHFLSAWIDRKNGEPRFAKADFRLSARKRASRAFNTITEKAAKAEPPLGFTRQTATTSLAGAQSTSMLIMGSTSKRADVRWKRSRFCCNSHSFI
jgi:hypothetical protein